MSLPPMAGGAARRCRITRGIIAPSVVSCALAERAIAAV
jgi:hypothetical protein